MYLHLLERGLKLSVRLIPGDTCFLVCCTDFIKKVLIGYVSGDFYDTGRRGQVGGKV